MMNLDPSKMTLSVSALVAVLGGAWKGYDWLCDTFASQEQVQAQGRLLAQEIMERKRGELTDRIAAIERIARERRTEEQRETLARLKLDLQALR
jgi:hypothetical protein